MDWFRGSTDVQPAGQTHAPSKAKAIFDALKKLDPTGPSPIPEQEILTHPPNGPEPGSSSTFDHVVGGFFEGLYSDKEVSNILCMADG